MPGPFPIQLHPNHSGIPLCADKWNELPDGWDVCGVEPYRESGSAGDAQATIYWIGPWRTRKLFLDWAIGYVVNTVPTGDFVDSGYPPYFGVEIADAIPLPYVDFLGGYTRGIVTSTATRGKLHRVIPTQHPEMPWLYAQEYELVRPAGVASDRDDITVKKGSLSLPFAVWDADLYNAPDPRPDPNADPAVILANTRWRDLRDALTGVTTDYPIGRARMEAFYRQLGPQANDPAFDAIWDGLPDVWGAMSWSDILALQTTSFSARDFVTRLRNSEEELRARLDASIAAFQLAQAAIEATYGRTLVPMIYYKSRTPTHANTELENALGLGELEDNGLVVYAITYRPVDYEVRTDREIDSGGFNDPLELSRYVTRDAQDASKAFQIQGAQLAFVEGPNTGNAVPTAGTAIIAMQELVYVWHDVPDVPEAAITACVGRINSTAFDGKRGAPTYPARTLLCEAPVRGPRKRGIRGRVVRDITFKFLRNVNGWDKFPDADGNFYRATYPSGRGPYLEADLNSLFVPPLPIDYQTEGFG